MLEQVVSVRVARHIASCTTDLTYEAANQADRIVCADPTRVSKVKAERLVDEIRLWFDPDRAVDDEQRALATRGVWMHEGRTPATTEMTFILDTPDAERFDQSLSEVAGILKGLGDRDDLETRRAKAVGILADPQHALDLMKGADHTPRTPQANTMFVHISEDSLTRTTDGTGPVVIEKLGAASTDLIRDWLKDSTVIIRPVLDLNHTEPFDTGGTYQWTLPHGDQLRVIPSSRKPITH